MKLMKKAQVGGLQTFILSIVTVAIVLAIGLIVISELKDAAKIMDTTSVINETVAHTAALGQSSLLISANACRNLSTQSVLTIGTQCNISAGGVVNVLNGSTASIDYSHYTPSAAYNSSGTILAKMATIPTWIGIVIIVALSFVVLSYFIGKRQ